MLVPKKTENPYAELNPYPLIVITYPPGTTDDGLIVVIVNGILVTQILFPYPTAV